MLTPLAPLQPSLRKHRRQKHGLKSKVPGDDPTLALSPAGLPRAPAPTMGLIQVPSPGLAVGVPLTGSGQQLLPTAPMDLVEAAIAAIRNQATYVEHS